MNSSDSICKRTGKELPDILSGFEGISRYWDPQEDMAVAKILPGEFYVTRRSETIVTVLGSCISACIRDPLTKIGGMNHFMLPSTTNEGEDWGGSPLSAENRYGNYAMENLINAIIRTGGARNRFEVKIFGGGQVLANMTDVGARNINFVREYLESESLKILAEDVGTIHPRKVYYFPETGKVQVKRLRRLKNDTIERREREYIKKIGGEPVQGAVELFD